MYGDRTRTTKMRKIYNNITQLSKSLLPYMLGSSGGVIKSNAYHIFDVLLQSKTCEYDIDLGLITGHTKNRWTKLISQYIDRTRLDSFIELARGLDNQCSVAMQFKAVTPRKLHHQYGNCLLAIVYSNNTLTLFSRTCYVGYMSYFDLALAHKIACTIKDPKDIRFKWYISDLQVSFLRTLQVIMLDKDLNKKLVQLSKHPKKLAQSSVSWQRIVGVYRRRFLYHYEKSGDSILEEIKYGPTKRYVKKWLILQNKLPGTYPQSFTVRELSL